MIQPVYRLPMSTRRGSRLGLPYPRGCCGGLRICGFEDLHCPIRCRYYAHSAIQHKHPLVILCLRCSPFKVLRIPIPTREPESCPNSENEPWGLFSGVGTRFHGFFFGRLGTETRCFKSSMKLTLCGLGTASIDFLTVMAIIDVTNLPQPAKERNQAEPRVTIGIM